MDIVKGISIGSVRLPNNLMLAPMAGVCDMPFRMICKEKGAGLVCMEMVSAKGILYKNKNTAQLLETNEGERPVSLQLFGRDPEILGRIAGEIQGLPFDILDFNMGCPMPKIVNNGEGSALMKEPSLVEKILSALAKASQKPVTVKIRKGFDDKSVNAVEIARIAQSCGVSALAVHGRTREQYYSGEADWKIISEVKKAVDIPIIGNGDIACYKDIKRMYEMTGCDAFMIGRAARGNPWIFEQILKQSENDEKPSFDEVRKMIIRQAKMLSGLKGEYTAVREMRKHAGWYTAGYPGSAKLRVRINEAESISQLEEILKAGGLF